MSIRKLSRRVRKSWSHVGHVGYCRMWELPWPSTEMWILSAQCIMGFHIILHSE